MKAYFFGCWNTAGHFWFKPGGHDVPRDEKHAIPFLRWIDTGWAPRSFKQGRFTNRALVADPDCCFLFESGKDNEARDLSYDTEEYPQGRFLLHVRGWTLISWWDRAQGDLRGACNSNFVLEGEHSAEAMVDALREYFPHVVANLKHAGVELNPARAA